MFDRTSISVPERPVNVHITQQPNDAADAARLYGELREKADAEVANAVVERLGADNELNVVTIESQKNFCTDTMEMRVLFKINGHMHQVICKPDRHELASQMYRTIAEYVAGEVWRKLSAARTLT
jgi:hypothetical protein